MLWVIGPGLLVMLADTDAGSIVTAAQSGASWGYRLLPLELLLIPPLYVVMELTLREHQIRLARIDTGLGAILTQVVMVAVLVVPATTLAGHRGSSLTSIGEISTALSPYLGASASGITLARGIAGAAVLAGLVVSLAASWSVAEAFGSRRSLNDHPRRAPLFYGIYTICVIAGAGLVLVSRSLVRIAVDVEILNALLLPIVIGFLVALAWTTLPRPHHLRTGERLAAVLALGVVALVGAGWLALTLIPG